jgi:predicted transcriptional regulator
VTDATPHLSDHETAVLGLSTEDAYALWEVAHEVGGDQTVAADVVRRLLGLGLVELGIEDWTDDQPAFVVDGKYVEVPFTGDVDAALADPTSWQSDQTRKIVVWATEAGRASYFRDGG